jgi:probable HAF family extracellular repeat protein
MLGIGTLGGVSSEALAVSADGSTVVGSSYNSVPQIEAFIWTSSTGMVGLNTPGAGITWSKAIAVSADGSTVVGRRDVPHDPEAFPPVGPEAFIWTAATGMVGLGNLDSWDNPYSEAVGISSDGSTVIGKSNHSGRTQAFIWTNQTGMLGLGTLDETYSGRYSEPLKASADGTTVIGYSQTSSGRRPFIWTAETGMVDIQVLLSTEYGVDLTGWNFDWVSDLSEDGTKIVGSGTNPDGDYMGWLAVLEQNVPNTQPGPDVVVEPADTNTGQAPVSLTFQEVTVAGETTLTTSQGAEPPTGFKLGNPATFYELETTAEFNGSVEICINYSGVSYDDEPGLRLFHFEDGAWIDVTTSLDTENDIICGQVTSFSPFAILELDSDEDGLADARELVLGSDPDDPDTDEDGLLDGTEVEMAAGSGCPDPLNPDSDGDTLLDGFGELPLGTSPCNPDTDGDQVPDQIDPDPLMPGEVGDVLEEIARLICLDFQSIDLSEFNGPNNNANKGRRNSLSTRCANAANYIAEDDFDSAIALFHTVLDKIDGIEPVPDWMVESNAKSGLAADVSLLIELLLLE